MGKIFKILKSNKLLLGIFIVSLFFRLYNISNVPYALDGDEAAFGYYGFSLLNNLSDEYGNKLPLYFPSIGDYKYPVYAYLTSIPVFVFGLNEFATRFISALSGSILVLLIYLITSLLTKKKELGLISAFVAACSPYGLIFSRGAYESNLSMLFITTGVFMILKYVNTTKSKFIYFSIIPFLLAVFTYSSARAFLLIFLPVLIGYLYFLFKPLKTKNLKNVFVVALIIIIVSLVSFIDPRSLVRAKSVGILSDPLNTTSLNEQILEDGRHSPGKYLQITRFFHNKPVVYTLNFVKRYFEHFNPVYLFVESNKSLNKYSVPGIGLFYFFEFFTILIGIGSLIKINKKLIIFPLWILVSVIPSALTIETPNPIRTLPGLPAWIILSSVGIFTIFSFFKKQIKFVFALFGLMYLIGIAYFLHQYFIHDITHEPWYTDGGVKEMVIESTKLSANFEKVIVPKDPYIFFLFYNKISPKDFLNNSDIKPESLGKWERVDRIGKFIFNMPTKCPKIGRKNVLYVCSGGDVPINGVVHKVIYFNDGTAAFSLIEFIPLSEVKKVELPEGLNWMAETDKSYKESLLDESSGRYW